MTQRIREIYEQAVRELAEVDAYRQRLIGRCDLLRELVAAGLGEVPVATAEGTPRGTDAEPLPEDDALAVHETQGVGRDDAKIGR